MRRYTCLLVLCQSCNYHTTQEIADTEVLSASVSANIQSTSDQFEEPSTDKETPPTKLESPVSSHEWNNEARIWLARSLIGEVGWNRPAEQSAVAWVYANRAKKLKSYTFTQMVRRYSAAVRQAGKRRQPWVFDLQLDTSKPKSWPNFIKWKDQHDKYWLSVLSLIDEWQAGKVPNYCPTANHFGSYHDSLRAEALRWTRVECIVPDGGKRFRNRFYDSTTLRPRRRRPRQS